jgi:transcriptional regulator with XRE-family HTH domain
MENIEEALKDRVRRLRKEAGMTIAELAKASMVSDQTIKDIEAGRRGVGVDALVGLSRVFNVTMEELLFNKDLTYKERPKDIEPISVLAKRLTKIPDAIYDKAQDLDPSDPVWETIEKLLEETAKALAKNSNHA